MCDWFLIFSDPVNRWWYYSIWLTVKTFRGLSLDVIARTSLLRNHTLFNHLYRHIMYNWFLIFSDPVLRWWYYSIWLTVRYPRHPHLMLYARNIIIMNYTSFNHLYRHIMCDWFLIFSDPVIRWWYYSI